MKLNFISSIWDDDCIEIIDDNKWKGNWCDTTVQRINVTKAMDHVPGTKGMHINIYFSAIDR